ncbi:MAG: DUF72 domain-containing protein [Planctomycetota bacterium]|nr:MAG: DUF72 domain-containing protein [Planctomycetota bacterium]
MSKADCDIRVGTSGWHYNHWTRVFYPADLPKSKWFGHYAAHFDTVEINNTFYQLPKQQTFELWRRQAPENFVYTVKANRYITHIKRLKEPAEPLERFFAGALLLKEKLGPILYQLPPSFHKDLDRLRTFLEALPRERLAIFEFRHKSWFSEDTYELLDKFKAGFCIHDMPGMKVPRVVTGGVIYLRFHGTTGRYSGNYAKAALKKWADWVKEHTREARSIYAYFNNDFGGYAVVNAKLLKELLLK